MTGQVIHEPLHVVVDKWKGRVQPPVREPCVCGGPDIVASSHSDADRMAAVQRHQIEPLHIAYDLANGTPLSRWQDMARNGR